MDFLSVFIAVVIGALSILVTVLTGWNIYTVFKFKEDVKRITIDTVKKIIEDKYLSDDEIRQIIEKAD